MKKVEQFLYYIHDFSQSMWFNKAYFIFIGILIGGIILLILEEKYDEK